MDAAKEQALLEAERLEQVLMLILDHLSHETQVLELRNRIATQAQTEMSKEQRDISCASKCGPSRTNSARTRRKRPRFQPSGSA